MPREAVEMLRHLLLNKDAPEHTKLRKLISKLFTPRAINGMRDELDRRARSIVDTAVSEGPGDFVKQV
ncbi:steroid C27-monooxygenase, partial [Rhodococcus erythropolis]|nr:steroid C27-monooxygenase [Rhodococcus erythropolis]